MFFNQNNFFVTMKKFKNLISYPLNHYEIDFSLFVVDFSSLFMLRNLCSKPGPFW